MKTEITKEELRDLYYNNTNDYVCEKLGVSKVTLISYLEKAGIPLKGKGHKKKIVFVD